MQQVGATLQLRCSGFSLQQLHLSWSTGSKACRLQQLWFPGPRAQASVVVARGLCCLLECGIFLEQGSTRAPCIARWILNHWTTREAQGWTLSSGRNIDPDPGEPEAQRRVPSCSLANCTLGSSLTPMFINENLSRV